MPVLSVDELTVEDGRTGTVLVDHVTFELRQGELVCLTGPSGSGKSTTALAVVGLLPSGLRITHGQVRLGDHDLTQATPVELAQIRGAKIGMIFQDPLSSLNPVLPCGIQAEEPLKLYTALTRQQRRDTVLATFRELGFTEPKRIYRSLPAQLSGGQRQRVMLAMAIALAPQVLIADEPTTALDPDSADLILEHLSRLRAQRGMAILLITHDRELAKVHASRVIRMRVGRITGDGRSPGVDLERPRQAMNAAEHNKGRAQPLLSIKSLCKSFVRDNPLSGRVDRVVALEDVALTVYPGEIVGIVGESGTGKTTLGRCIAGLEMPDGGQIQLDGYQLQGRSNRSGPHPIQVVYQSPYASLNPVMRVGEAIEEGLRSRGIPPLERKPIALALLAKVGLPPTYYQRFPKALSGGERQRVAIARCLAAEPKLLVADEPTASLDEETKHGILKVFLTLARESGLSVLLISHDLKVVTQVCVRTFQLKRGRLAPLDGPVPAEMKIAAASNQKESMV